MIETDRAARLRELLEALKDEMGVVDWHHLDPALRAKVDAELAAAEPPPQPLGVGPVTWESAARRLGEMLASDGPNGYGAFTPEQWLSWASAQVRKESR